MAWDRSNDINNTKEAGEITSVYKATGSGGIGGPNTLDLFGAGGCETDIDSSSTDNYTHGTQLVHGNTTLVQRYVQARWTYGGAYWGCQIGNSRNVLDGASVYTMEGGGYQGHVRIGSSTSIVKAGEVNWFLAGGGWADNYQSGDATVIVEDNPRTKMDGTPITGSNGQILPAVVIHASMGGSYGIEDYDNQSTSAYPNLGHAIGGNSYVTIYGGDFRGTASGSPTSGFCTGPTNDGRIYGNGVMTMDFRDNEYGFFIESGDRVSAGRSYNDDGNDTRIGTNYEQSLTLNVLSSASSKAVLSGLNFYGDAADVNGGTTEAAGNSFIGKINLNVNAPGAQIGTLYATAYSNISGGALLRDVDVNLVSAGSIEGISATAPTDNLTKAIADASASATPAKAAEVIVGPQVEDNGNAAGFITIGAGTDTTTEWILDNDETSYDEDGNLIPTADGYPEQIKVVAPSSGTSTGITNFTSMTIKERLILAQSGNVRNSAGATASSTTTNHGDAATGYSDFGDVTLLAGEGQMASGFGTTGTTGRVIVGELIVSGAGEAYVASTASELNQIVITDTTIPDGSELVWLKTGNATEKGFTPTGQSTWFGVNQGYQVLTINPEKANADKITPGNFRGIDMTTGKTFIGDSYGGIWGSHEDTPCLLNNPILQYILKWQVVKGPDNQSLGKVSHNVKGATTAKPAAGQSIDVYGTSPADTPSVSGSLAIPSAKIPTPVEWPIFKFIPDSDTGEWTAKLDINRSDMISNPDESYHEGEQSLADYQTESNRTRVWSMGDSNPDGSERSSDTNNGDHRYSFEMEVDYTSNVELEAESATVSANEGDDKQAEYFVGKTDEEIKAKAIELTGAAGRPFFNYGDFTEETYTKLKTPLAEGESIRVVPIKYTAGKGSGLVEKTVNIVIYKGDMDGDFILTAHDNTLSVSKAKKITNQRDDIDDPTSLDFYTGAQVYNWKTDAYLDPTLANAENVFNLLAAASADEDDNPVVANYTYQTPNKLLQYPSNLTITQGVPPVILINSKGDPTTPEANRVPGREYETDPLVVPIDSTGGNLTNDELLDGVTAYDDEDSTDDNVADPQVSLVGTPEIPKDKTGVYTITYTTADADDNEATRTRAVYVGITPGDDYGLLAKGYVVGKSKSTQVFLNDGTTNGQSSADAQASRNDGTTDGLTTIVKTPNSFVASTTGTFANIGIGLKDGDDEVVSPAVNEANITVFVYPEKTADDKAGKIDAGSGWTANGRFEK